MSTIKNNFTKTFVKYRPLYKIVENTMQIDHRIESYEYEIQTENSCVYTFDNDRKCTFISVIQEPIHNLDIESVFPYDLVDFITGLLDTTREKSICRVHGILNNIHILYSTSIISDQNNQPLGIVLTEYLFKNVQSIASVAPKIKKTFDQSKINIAYIINRSGMIFGTESDCLNTRLFNSIENNPIEERTELYDVFRCHVISRIFKVLIDYLLKDNNVPLLFNIYTDTDEFEQKTTLSLSRIKVITGDMRDLVLINSEVKLQKDFEFMQDYLAHDVIAVDGDGASSQQNYKICSSCKKIKCPKKNDKIEDDLLKKSIINYSDIIAPLCDIETDVPIFGRKARSGKISYKELDSGMIWLTPQQWNNFKLKNPQEVKIYTISYDMCHLCKDEYRYYLLKTLEIKEIFYF